MSRHRNVRNLTEDDYYDDYDDYDDDYYDEEDEEEYDQQYQRAPSNTAASLFTVTPTTTQQPSMADKERTLVSMGFTAAQAKTALGECKGDVERAAELLLASNTAAFLKPAVDSSGKSAVVSTPVTPTTVSSEVVVSKPKKVEFSKTTRIDTPKLPAHIQETLQKQKSRLSMVVLGHVDAGKSTLMGQVLLQVGYVQKRTIQKYQRQAAELGKASFALAWVMDEDESERQRGVTMEIATKSISTPTHTITILDAPGHADFVPSMITGAASADVGILVVAATRGEFEAGFVISRVHSGQTREHVVLARGLGVSQLIVAVNKLDAVDWSQGRFEEIRAILEPYLVANGFAPKRIRFVPVSGLTGDNVKTSGVPEWYKGPTLLEAIDSFVPAQRNFDKPLRAIAMDVYMEGKSVTCRCRIVQGVVQVGDKLVVLPLGDHAVVTRLEHGSSEEDRLKFAVAGDSVDLVLQNIDVARVTVGCILSHAHLGLRPPVRKKMQAKILVMEHLQVPIIRGAQVLLHMHSIDIPAVISRLLSSTKGSSTKTNPRVVTGGSSAVVEITLQEKVCLETFADCRALGRFVLRRGGETIAVGIIEHVL